MDINKKTSSGLCLHIHVPFQMRLLQCPLFCLQMCWFLDRLEIFGWIFWQANARGRMPHLHSTPSGSSQPTMDNIPSVSTDIETQYLTQLFLQVQVPASGSETIECGVCQHPFLVSSRWPPSRRVWSPEKSSL
jgi:hypothetical protein